MCQFKESLVDGLVPYFSGGIRGHQRFPLIPMHSQSYGGTGNSDCGAYKTTQLLCILYSGVEITALETSKDGVEPCGRCLGIRCH